MEEASCLEQLREADMILVGLGEEFDVPKKVRQKEEYKKGRDELKRTGLDWLLPAWNAYCSQEEDMMQKLKKLEEFLKDRNYFVVSVSTSDCVARIPWKNGRLVMPCGSAYRKQCACGCEESLFQITAQDEVKLNEFLKRLLDGHLQEPQEAMLGMCPKCGAPLVLNNVYAEHYDEQGYLEQWRIYTKWLQGTLNRRLVIMELGVGMQFPSVIRWPFEKIAFFNQKAFFLRVHESLYQLDEKLSGKGCGISQNAIDWLSQL